MAKALSRDPTNPSSEPSGNGRPSGMRLRMAKALADRLVEERSFSGLERAIERIVAQHAGDSDKKGAPKKVDRRKLQAIVRHDDNLVLSLGELKALDHYLDRFGHGLSYSPLFEKPAILRHIAESGRVAFLLGSKKDQFDPYRINISHFDFLSQSVIQNGLLDFSKHIYIDNREVRMYNNVDDARREFSNNEIKKLFLDDGPSLVCLGSIRGNQVSNWMLSFMAGIEDPFVDATSLVDPRFPFRFVWPYRRNYVINSPFHLYGRDVIHENREIGNKILDNKVSGFRYKDRSDKTRYRLDELSLDSSGGGYTYALCAAQRRPGGQVWLLVAGLTGPATYAAARWVNKMASGLDDQDENHGASAVYWTILRAHWERDSIDGHESIKVEDAEIVESNFAWATVDPIPKPDDLSTEQLEPQTPA